MRVAVDGTTTPPGTPPRTPARPDTSPEGQHGRPLRRVRQEARDALAVIAFSAAASVLLAVTITLVVALAG
jgi:hypothetical protein